MHAVALADLSNALWQANGDIVRGLDLGDLADNLEAFRQKADNMIVEFVYPAPVIG